MAGGLQDLKTLFIMCGCPGSGKSYIVKNKLVPHSHVVCISRDEIRFDFLKEEENYFAHEKEVYNWYIDNLVRALHNPLYDAVVADATHINWASRRKLINAIGKYIVFDNQLNIVPIVVKCKLEDAIARNAARGGRACVPEKVVRDMYARFQDPKRDPFNYDGILYIDN